MPVAAIALGAVAALGILLVAWAAAAPPDRARARLAGLKTPPPQTLEDIELRRPLAERTIRPIVARLSRGARRLSTTSFEVSTARRLAIAGDPAGLTPTEWVGVKVLVALVAGAAGALIMNALTTQTLRIVVLGGVGLGIGYLAPEFWLGRAGRARQQRILEAIPDAIDLLTISVRAGLGFDAALERVVARLDGPLSDEFRRALAEVRVGRPRREALHDIVERAQVKQLGTFITAIIQAERLGVPITTVLQVQSEQLRVERRQRAEEAASRAPIQMLFPLAGCIFPALFIVILGPAIILLSHTF